MRSCIELFDLLTSETVFQKRYPDYVLEDEKVHVLFVSPCMNALGYYRSILPFLELNKTSSHHAIVTDIHKWNFNEVLTDYVSPIDRRLIEWADYIVLPVLFQDASYLIQAWKAIHPEVQVVMDLNYNYHLMPSIHLDYMKFSRMDKNLLLGNIAKVDVVTAPSEGLLDYYDGLLEKFYPDSKVSMEFLPTLISKFGYQEIKPLKKHSNKKIRIGIVQGGATSYDVVAIKEVLQGLTAKYKDTVELIFFGWNGKVPGIENLLDGVKFTYYKAVRFLDYFDRLHEIQLDIALLPCQRLPFNTHGKSNIKFLEFSAFGIPVVASNNELYNEVIIDGETGFLANSSDEWLSKIKALVENKELRTTIGNNALKRVWKDFSYTGKAMEVLQEIFI